MLKTDKNRLHAMDFAILRAKLEIFENSFGSGCKSMIKKYVYKYEAIKWNN